MGKFRKFFADYKAAGVYHSIWIDPVEEATKQGKKTEPTFHIPRGLSQSTASTSTSTYFTPSERKDSIAELAGSNPEETQTHHELHEIEDTSERQISELPANPDADLLIFSNNTEPTIPFFGRQFGIAPTSIIRDKMAEPEPEPESTATKGKGCEAFFQQADAELDALYMGHLRASGRQKSEPGSTKTAKPKSGADACIICFEPFAAGVKAPDMISIACRHTPSVCCGCLAKSIKNDLETKFWDEIKCPECKTLLIHDDIKRLADKETFTRYDRLSFRHAVSADKNFVWCLSCDFGQLHEKGAAQPMVRCLNCSAISCFKHAIQWHDGFSCDEYDAVLWDPDSYRDAKAKSGPATKVEVMSKKSMDRAKSKEITRQNQLHEAQKKSARERQQKEAASKGSKDDLKEKMKILKRRKQEDELSAQTVERTTKRCPGCQRPIEKNEGCDHMTCIKCHAEFCWICMNDYKEIRRQGNSMHRRSCKYHTDNLP